MNTIRKYNPETDYKQICFWSKSMNQPTPPKEALPATTFILENSRGAAWLCVSLICTNSKHIAWVEGLLSNPDLPKTNRKFAVDELMNSVGDYAKSLGYKNVFLMAPNEKLMKRYKALGYVPTMTGITSMIKTLGGK